MIPEKRSAGSFDPAGASSQTFVLTNERHEQHQF
jgi:hypothetical protein